jgi:selenide,water dikinase
MNDLGAELPSIQLTELAHGGGCGCKLAPAVLQQLLTGQVATLFPQLLVGVPRSNPRNFWKHSIQALH